MKISSSTMRTLQELPEDERNKVEAIVRAHVDACRANGLEPENLERVYAEAIEIVQLEDRNSSQKDSVSEEEYREAIFTRSDYSVYRPPKSET